MFSIEYICKTWQQHSPKEGDAFAKGNSHPTTSQYKKNNSMNANWTAFVPVPRFTVLLY